MFRLKYDAVWGGINEKLLQHTDPKKQKSPTSRIGGGEARGGRAVSLTDGPDLDISLLDDGEGDPGTIDSHGIDGSDILELMDVDISNVLTFE